MSADVSQGSVLGPFLWNIMYNEVLKTKDRKDEYRLCGRRGPTRGEHGNVETKANDAKRRISSWLTNSGLVQVTHKTDEDYQHISMYVSSCSIKSNEAIKYLEILLDSRLSLGSHVTRRAGNPKIRRDLLMLSIRERHPRR